MIESRIAQILDAPGASSKDQMMNLVALWNAHGCDFSAEEFLAYCEVLGSQDARPPRWVAEVLADTALSSSLGLFADQLAVVSRWIVRAGCRQRTFLNAVAGRCLPRISGLSTLGVTYLIWSFAKTKVNDPRVFTAVSAEVCRRSHAFPAAELVRILWAFATVGCNDRVLFGVVAARAVERAEEFEPKRITNTLWACAKLRYVDATLFETLAGAAHEKAGDFNPQGIANTLWACATLRYDNAALFETLAGATQEKAGDFNPQDIAHTLWACAKLRYVNATLFETLAGAAHEKAGNFNPQGIANTLWACATLRYVDEALFETLAGAAHKKAGNFDPQEIANTLWACATLRYVDATLFEALAGAAHEKAGNFNPQDIAHTLWACAKLGHVDAALFETLAGVAREKAGDFKPQNIANTLWACATLGHVDAALFEALAGAAHEKAGNFDPQGIANTLWACATLRYVDATLFEALAGAAHEKAGNFNPQDIAHTLWACAKLGHVDAALFETLAGVAREKAGDFKPQNIANTLWACATLGHVDAALFETLAGTAHKKAENFNPQDIANTLWACAKLGHVDAALFETLAGVAHKKAGDFNPQGIANTLWACATLRYDNAALFETLAGVAHKKAGDFNPQGIANTLWACATLRYVDEALFEAMAGAAHKKAGSFDPQNIANTLWACATLRYVDEALFEAMAGAAHEKDGDFDPQNIANTLWACATLRYVDATLFETLAGAAHEKAGDFNPQNIANTLWACATLRYVDEALFEAMAGVAREKAGDFNPQNIANTLWACAKLGHVDAALFETLAGVAREKAAAFDPQGISMTAWAYASLDHPDPSLSNALWDALNKKLGAATSQTLAQAFMAFVTWRDSQNDEAAEALVLEAEKRSGDLSIFDFATLAAGLERLGAARLSLFERFAARLPSLITKRFPAKLFRSVSRALTTALELQGDAFLDNVRTVYRDFHWRWLRALLASNQLNQIPEALAALQGRKSAAWLGTFGKDAAAPSAFEPEIARLQLALGAGPVDEDNAEEDTQALLKLVDARRASLDAQGLARWKDVRMSVQVEVGQIYRALGNRRALLLLFEVPVDVPGGESRAQIIVFRNRQDPVHVELSALSQLAIAMQGYVDRRGLHLRGLRKGPDTGDHPSIAPPFRDIDGIEQEMREILWDTLLPHLDGVREIDVVPQGNLHMLPYGLGAPSGCRINHFPNLLLYYQQRSVLTNRTEVRDEPSGTTLAVQVYSAEDYPDSAFKPIPMVTCESRLLERFGAEIVDATQGLPDAAVLHLAGHGTSEEPARLILGKDRFLGMREIIGSEHCPRIVFVGACMAGRSREDADGDPLGLVSGLLLQGAEYVVAALNAVEDFYMPLLSCLFYQGLQHGMRPDRALASAKKRMASGDWYDETATLVREIYREGMLGALRNVDSISSPEALVSGWHGIARFPRNGLLALLSEQPVALVDEVIDRLIDDRAQLPVANMLAWMRGFGLARAPLKAFPVLTPATRRH